MPSLYRNKDSLFTSTNIFSNENEGFNNSSIKKYSFFNGLMNQKAGVNPQ